MGTDIYRMVQEVKATLTDPYKDASRQLVKFADEFAISRQLRHQALLLRRDMIRAKDQERKIELNQKILTLVDNIVEDHEANKTSERVQARWQKVKQVRTHFREQRPPRDIVFACEELGKSYKKSEFSLTGINLELRLGDVLGVVGQNGFGKTTLFRLIAGELLHDQGALAFPHLGERSEPHLDWVKAKSILAYVPEHLPRWYGSLQDNLHYEASLRGLQGKANEREVDYIIERLALGEHLDRHWQQLSAGFKLRFALAKALVSKPQLLLLDEPFANLDVKAQQIIIDDIRHLAKSLKNPIAVMISSQHLHEVEALSDYMLFLDLGKVLFHGPTSAIGEDRSRNIFELTTSCSLEELRRVLQDSAYKEIYETGITIAVHTDLTITPEILLRKLLDEQIKIEYFRNISKSTKRYLEESN